MSYSNPIRGVISSNNSNSTLASTAFSTRVNTLQAGTATTVTLDASASASDDIYNNQVIEILSGTGIGFSALITDYNGTTKVATATFGVVPDSTSKYVIHTHSGQLQSQTQINKYKTITLGSNASSNDDFYNGCYIAFLGGKGNGEFAKITDYTGSSKLATINKNLSVPICSNTLYAIFGESGTAASGTSTTIVLEASHGHSADDDYYNNLIIEIVDGTGIGQSKTITDYTGSTRTCTVSTWTTNPDNTSVYEIYGGWSGTYEQCKDYTQLTNALVASTGEYGIIDQQIGLDSTGSKKIGKTSIYTSKLPSTVHTLAIVTDYFKIRVIGMGTALTGHIQTTFHTAKNKALTSFLDEEINNQNDCELTRSIITGQLNNNKFINIRAEPNGGLLVDMGKPVTSFGEIITTSTNPIEELAFSYNINEAVQDVDGGTLLNISTEGSGDAAQVQSIYFPSGNQFSSSGAGDYFQISAGGGQVFYVWFDVSNGNSDPAPGGTGIEVDITASDSANTVASNAQTAIDGNINFSAVVTLGNIVTITNAANGSVQSIQPGTMPTTTESTATHDVSNSAITITNMAGIGAYSVFRSKRAIPNRPNVSCEGRFNTQFDTAAAGTDQLSGIGNQVSGYFFGYNGTDFGVMHRSTGQPEIRKLQLTGSATTSETANVTVDGIDFQVAITSGTTPHNAYEIASSTIFRRGDWLTESVNDSIYFLSVTGTSAREKSYTFSSTSNASGTWSTIATGIGITNTWVNQTEWSENRLFGYGNTDMILDPTKINTYNITYQNGGTGVAIFSIEDSGTGKLIDVHRIINNNNTITPSLSMPYLRLLSAVYTDAASTSVTLKYFSGSLFVQGIIKVQENLFSTTASLTTSDANETPIISLRNRRIFGSKGNNVEIIFKEIQFSNDANKSGVVRIYLDGTIGETNYIPVDVNNSSIVYDMTNTTVPTGGRLIASLQIAGNSIVDTDTTKFGLILYNNEILTITVQRNTTTNVEVNAAFIWSEDK